MKRNFLLGAPTANNLFCCPDDAKHANVLAAIRARRASPRQRSHRFPRVDELAFGFAFSERVPVAQGHNNRVFVGSNRLVEVGWDPPSAASLAGATKVRSSSSAIRGGAWNG